MVFKEFAREAVSMDKVKSDGEALMAAGDGEEDDVVLPGFRFHPTDEELVTFYPAEEASTVGGEKEWYFFCLRGRKYRNSIRPNRVTGSGFWKATGIDRPIYSGESIGLKKSLVYYRGSAGKGTKTDWMMHEFRLPPVAAATNSSPSMQEAEVWTICRIFKRNITYKRQQQQQQVWRHPPAGSNALPPADSSSNTGSFESDGGYEYMNRLPVTAPGISQHQHVSNQANMLYGGSSSSFFRDSMHSQQWFNLTVPVQEQKPQVNPSAMTIAFQQNHAANEFYRDSYLDEISRFMEISDPTSTAFYDSRYA
ncbi:hypothetical protein PR202_gb10755 [Eleusine coracana subsp. coracana]|uniref:NAC domain-containing protein n=1 Tax=Eleusine coracana subsp. coracana TaxID=191504 RepID=A0AAV5EKT7_ELECO|nr:hypothetical protein PR202_gb10755 [Eleusine coracana subsp. coracana]